MITGASLKKLRNEAGLTQNHLAMLAGVSQAHIAKIEKGKVDPRLSTINKVLQVLNESRNVKCRDIMSHGVISARVNDRILEVSDKMVRHGISQVPIMNGNKVVGTVTEESIMRRLGSNLSEKTAEKVMAAPLPVVDEEVDVEKARKLLKTYQGVLISRDNKIIGIVTRSDLLKVICEPI